MRRLAAKEIQVRIDRFVGGNPANNMKPMYGVLFLYIDARTAQNMLDEEFGPTGWKAEYNISQSGAVCSISVWDKEKNEWVVRQDVGSASGVSTADTAKSMVSDAFKRTAVAWGVGRELYLGPQIKYDTANINLRNSGGKFACYDEFVCSGVDYDERGHITALRIVDVTTNRVVYDYDVRPNELTPEEIKKFEAAFKAKGIDTKRVVEFLGLKDFKEINRKQVKDIMSNPSVLEPKGEEAVKALPNTTKGMPDDMPKGKEDFMTIEDEVDEELPFK